MLRLDRARLPAATVLARSDSSRILESHGKFGRAFVPDEGSDLGDLTVGFPEQFRGELHPHSAHIRRRRGSVDALEALLKAVRDMPASFAARSTVTFSERLDTMKPCAFLTRATFERG